jgi:arsenite methyltransferase
MSLFTVDEARATLAGLRPALDEFVLLRADAAELAAAVRTGEPNRLGGLPELKAMEARIDELLTEVQQTGVDVKGFAPLLLDFPAELDGEDVLLCWLEGDDELAWYHRTDLGFLGRRRLPGKGIEG